jgi:hypothetical protein
MRIKSNNLLLIAFAVLSISIHSAFGQTVIDRNVTVNFPGEPERLDTTTEKQKLSIFILDADSEVYMVMKTVMDLGEEENNHVADSKELDSRYRGSLRGQNNKMKEAGLVLLDSNRISIDEHVAYQMQYGIEGTNEPYTEMVSLILNRTLYSFSYVGNTSFNKDQCSKFFKSITVRNAKRPKPHLDQSAEKIGELIGMGLGALMLAAVVGIIIFIISRSNRKKNN